MAKELDNKKMWASIRKESSCMASKLELVGLIDFALKEQGFKFDGEDIVPIAEVNEPQLPYVAIKDFSDPKYDNKTLHLPVFCKDEIVTKEKVFKMIPYMTEELFNECFRPNVPEQRRMELHAGGEISGQIGGQIGGQKPKFKEGDWVVYDNKIVCHIDDIYQGKWSLMYTITDTNNMTRSYSVKGFDANSRLWTIYDAREGDVFADNDAIIIFRKIGNDRWLNVIDFCCGYRESVGLSIPSGDSYWNTIGNSKLKPATKEQRDLLFAKIKEAGYEWDAKKKELSHSEEPTTVYRDELTEFDNKLCHMLQKFRYLDQPVTNGDILEYVEKNSKELQAIARKQIADKAIEFVKTHICMFKSMEEVDLFNELFEKNIKGE